MPNTFGHSYRITTFGESHGGAVGVVIDGVPPGYQLDLQKVQEWLDRRRPGQSHLSSPRKEKDSLNVLSGIEDGTTLGTPIALMIRNEDQIPGHYKDMAEVFRPSHADFTTWAKYGIKAKSGGGRASARETIGRVAGAAVAEQILLSHLPGLEVVAFVDSVKGLRASGFKIEDMKRSLIENNPLRCPPCPERDGMEQTIVDAQKAGDTVGGTITCVIKGLPPGLGDPVFDKFEADLAKGMLSLPATKGFEIGSGFASTGFFGSEHNDPFFHRADGSIGTTTNRSGGVQGGITNGEMVYFRVAFKPVATVFKEQQSVNEKGEDVVLKPKAGRHDPCVLPRAVPMVEAMAVLVVMDHWLRQIPYQTARGPQSRQP
jgi:chorismate synthase